MAPGMGTNGTPERGDGISLPREAHHEVAGLRVDHVELAVYGTPGDALGYGARASEEFLLYEGSVCNAFISSAASM